MSDEYTQQIIEDTEFEESHTLDGDENGYMSDDDINRLWSEHMHDFVPEDMTNVIVEAGETESLFDYIGHQTPTTVKGAYYVLGGNVDKTVDCLVYDPNRDLIYKRKGSAQGILLFDTTIAGEYAIIFVNKKSGIDLTVTLALHTYEEKKEEIRYDILPDGMTRVILDPEGTGPDPAEVMGGEENLAATEEEVYNVRSMLREIQTSVKQIQSEAKLSMMRQNGHNEDLLENQDWNFYFMLVEVVCFFGIVAFQTNHIMKLLDNKLVI